MTRIDTEPLLDLRNVHKTFGRRNPVHAVKDVSLQVHTGSAVGLVGESGSGKSTLARIMMALERPTSGAVFFDGAPLDKFRGREMRAFRRRVQMVYQDPFGSLIPSLSALGNVSEPLRIHRIGTSASRSDAARALLARVGIPIESMGLYPRQFSGGQQQRIAIARALALEPEVLICDEPTSALDVSIQAQVLMLLGELRRENNLTLVVISHNLAVIEQMCEEVVVMRTGQVVETCPVADLFSDPRHPYSRQLLNSALPVEGSQGASPLETPFTVDGPESCLVDIGGGHWVRDSLQG